MNVRSQEWMIAAGLTVILIIAGIAYGNARAELPKKGYLTLETAQKIAAVAAKKCRDDGYSVTVTVVDREGVTLVQLRNEMAGPHTLNSSYKKAFTAASLGRSTGDLTNMVKDKPELFGLRNMDDRIIILGGGLPVMLENELVGGIGVGGAPGGNLDEACAKFGLDNFSK